MHIERAYCVELGRVVNIYEARDYFFRQAPPRRRFQFLCSDANCRVAKGTKVTGVNYDKLIEENDQYVKPHFRENTEHLPDCEWVELEAALTELKKETDDDPGKESYARRARRKRPKTSDVVDIFVPSSEVCAPDICPGSVGIFSGDKSAEIKYILRKKDRIEAIKKHVRENLNQTSFLENVVDSFLTLEMEEKRSTGLKIGRSRWRSYRECFRPIKFYGRGRDEEFIYYGGVRAKRFGPNFSLKFFDKVEFNGMERWVSLYIKKEKLARYRHRSYLTEFLEKLVSKQARYATCFFYGHIRPSTENEAFLDVELDHFDNLVLILR